MALTEHSLPLVESAESVQLRRTLRAIGESYGHDYFVRTARTERASPRHEVTDSVLVSGPA